MIVTGASRGIGAAVARLAALDGWSVCVNYAREADAAQRVVADIAEHGGRALAVQADVAIEADVLRLFDTVDRQWGRPQALVNNAGVVDRASPVRDMSVARLRRMFDINVIGSFVCAREAIRRMARSAGGDGGTIVNVGSVASRLGSPNEYIDYAASKGAIDTFTVGLSKEVAAEGIRVNCVRPGLTVTDIHASGGAPDRIERLRGLIPLQRGGQPDEIAQAIVWLASDAASYVTGAILDVGGGR